MAWGRRAWRVKSIFHWRRLNASSKPISPPIQGCIGTRWNRVNKARELGYTSTLLGRRRYLPELFSDNQGMRVAAEYMAVNTPVQGSSADLIKLAMINIQGATAA